MNLLRLLSVVMAVTATALLVSGTMGFSASSAERGVSAEVVSDDEAYVGYEPAPESEFDTIVSIAGWPEQSLVEVDNRFTGDLSVTEVSAESDKIAVDIDKPTNIHPGEADTIDGSLTCDSLFVKETIGLTITTESHGVSATLDGDTTYREFTAICIGNPFASLDADHSAQQGITTASAHSETSIEAGDSVEATLEIANEDGAIETVSGTWTVPDASSIGTDLGDGFKLISVKLPEYDVMFEDPTPQRAASNNESFDPADVPGETPLNGFEVDE